jgi:hypothetical protein
MYDNPEDISDFIEYVIKYTQAVQAGVDRFIEFLPIMIRGHMAALAQQRLHSTKQRFLDAVRFQADKEVLVCTMDKDDWLALAVETGVPEFDMKDRLKTSPKAKTAKDGHKFMVIPIGPLSKAGPGSNTEKGQTYQSLIAQTLTRPKYGKEKVKVNMNGTVDTIREVVAKDQRVNGMYQVRKYANNMARESGQSPLSSKTVMFRVMSDKQDGKWIHPGIKAANIFKDTQVWINGVMESTLESFIQEELKSIK